MSDDEYMSEDIPENMSDDEYMSENIPENMNNNDCNTVLNQSAININNNNDNFFKEIIQYICINLSIDYIDNNDIILNNIEKYLEREQLGGEEEFEYSVDKNNILRLLDILYYLDYLQTTNRVYACCIREIERRFILNDDT